jgi:hypothetical protein
VNAEIADLEARIVAIERRLAALEGEKAESGPQAETRAVTPGGDGFAATASTHIGRVLLIFGGAYLLRAITDYGFVPTALGLLLGASYALVWLVMAWRRAGVEAERVKAEFFGGTSVVLGLPLLYEAANRFALLSGTQAVVAVAVYFTLALATATRHRMTVLAWMTTAGSIAVAIALLVSARAAIPVAAFLILLGIGSLWAVYLRDWLGLHWLGALGANVGVGALIALSLSDRWPISPALAFGFAVVLLISYLANITFQTHVRGRLVNLLEAAQTAVAGLIVLAAAVVAVRAGDLGMQAVGIMGLVLGAGGYGLAIARETRTLRYRNFFYYSSFGLVFLLVGTGILLPMDGSSAVWALLAAAMAYFSFRVGWVSLSLQCTILLVAASAGSGLLATGLETLVGDPQDGWVVVSPAQILVALTTVACLFIPVAQRSERWGTLAELPQLLVLILSVWSVGGLFIAVVAPAIAGVQGPEPSMAALAALRTVMLSVAAVTLAFSSRHARWPEARWLVYPVLVLVGIKLFVEDFPNGEPTALFVALGFVGSALLLVAPLLKRADD